VIGGRRPGLIDIGIREMAETGDIQSQRLTKTDLQKEAAGDRGDQVKERIAFLTPKKSVGST
jgi:hypothetical protein